VRSATVQVAKRGLITIPKELRDAYGIGEGDTLTLLDLGGVFVVSPRVSRVDAMAERLAAEWRGQGVTLDEMLAVLRERRAGHGR
jgi:AbrB family looped-hinge helix DNA binding protein